MAVRIPKHVLDAHVECIIEPFETMASARKRARSEIWQIHHDIAGADKPQRRPRKPSVRGASATVIASAVAGESAMASASAAVVTSASDVAGASPARGEVECGTATNAAEEAVDATGAQPTLQRQRRAANQDGKRRRKTPQGTEAASTRPYHYRPPVVRNAADTASRA